MSCFNFNVITLFPKAFESINNLGVITRALDKNLINLNLHDLREYGEGAYRQVDDKPYGGGAGMVLKPEPIFKVHESIQKSPKSKTLLMTPQGKVLKQNDLAKWSTLDQLIIICGQYEGFDERIRCLADEEISIGDYVLSGGELAAAVFCDAIIRLIPGVLGNETSALTDSFQDNLLAPPIYTRPADYKGNKVPDILTSGNTPKVEEWREKQAEQRTKKLRPDLL